MPVQELLAGKKGNGKKAREGLVRAYFCDQGVSFESGKWLEVSRLYRRFMGLALGRNPWRAEVERKGDGLGQSTMNTAETIESKDGARAMRGNGSGAKGQLWSMRDLRVRV